jgi:hypothetical protein
LGGVVVNNGVFAIGTTYDSAKGEIDLLADDKKIFIFGKSSDNSYSYMSSPRDIRWIFSGGKNIILTNDSSKNIMRSNTSIGF